MADDGHTINVGPVTIGEPLPKATELDRLRAENAALRRDGAVVAGYILGWTPEQRAMFPSSEARIAAADICAHRLREADRG